MALERRNPVPAGTYWLDVFGRNIAAFDGWLSQNRGAVKVLASEAHNSEPPRNWVKFQVLAPVAWQATVFGFPTIIAAGSAVNSSQDTASAGAIPEPDPVDQIASTINGSNNAFKLIGGALLALAVVSAVSTFRVPRRAQ